MGERMKIPKGCRCGGCRAFKRVWRATHTKSANERRRRLVNKIVQSITHSESPKKRIMG